MMEGMVRKIVGGTATVAMTAAMVATVPVQTTATASAALMDSTAEQQCGGTLEEWTRAEDKVWFTGTLNQSTGEGELDWLVNVYFDSGHVDAHATRLSDDEWTLHFNGAYNAGNVRGNSFVLYLRRQDGSGGNYEFEFYRPSCSVVTGNVDNATLSVDHGWLLGPVKAAAF